MLTSLDVTWPKGAACLQSGPCHPWLRFTIGACFVLFGLFPLISAGTPSDTGATARDGPTSEAASHADTEKSSFSLDQYRWQKRLLVVSAPRQDDQQLRNQLDAVSATRGPFEERDMLMVILLREGVSTAGDRVLSSEEAATVRKRLGIAPDSFALILVGKDGGIKLASRDTVPMAEIFALIDTMPMRRREMGER